MDKKEMRVFIRREEKKGFRDSELRQFLYKKNCSVEDVDEVLLDLREEKIKKEEYTETRPFFRKIRMLFLKPSLFFDEIEQDRDLGEAIKHFIYVNMLLLPIYVIAFFFIFYRMSGFLFFSSGLSVIASLVFVLLSPLFLIILVYVIGLYLMLFGSDWDFLRTSQMLSYSLTVPLLLFWIPFVNIAALLYFFYILYIGLQKLHDMKAWQAVLAEVILIILVALVMII